MQVLKVENEKGFFMVSVAMTGTGVRVVLSKIFLINSNNISRSSNIGRAHQYGANILAVTHATCTRNAMDNAFVADFC